MTFLDHEHWKDIDGFEGQYRISDKGRVWSIARLVREGGKTGTVITKDMILKTRKDEKGYVRVFLNEDGKTRWLPVHRLVAQAFIQNPENKPQVNHIDGDKTNNHASNLEWCTNSENQKHAYRIGLNYVTGRAGRKKVPVVMVDAETGRTLGRYESLNDASRQTGIVAQNIRKVIMGERKRAGGYGWKKEVM